MANITNLKGSIWFLKKGWTATAGIGKFTIIGKVTMNSNSFPFSILRVGYYTGEDQTIENNIHLQTGNYSINNTNAICISFDGGVDETNADLIAWLESTGVYLGAVSKLFTTITYNGAELATIEAGQTATIKCAGAKMASDLVITLN